LKAFFIKRSPTPKGQSFFFKVLRLRSFVLLTRVARSWRWAWIVGWMTLTRKNRRNTHSSALCNTKLLPTGIEAGSPR